MDRWLWQAATPQDAPFMAQLYAATQGQAWGLSPDAPDPVLQGLLAQQHRWRDGAYAEATGGLGCRLIVAADSGTPVGRAWVHESETLHLLDLAVLPAHQRQGIGQWALSALQAEAARAQRPLTLMVDASNPARRLYQRLGFDDIGDNGPDRQMRWTPAPLTLECHDEQA